jgi:hypothetical protein
LLSSTQNNTNTQIQGLAKHALHGTGQVKFHHTNFSARFLKSSTISSMLSIFHIEINGLVFFDEKKCMPSLCFGRSAIILQAFLNHGLSVQYSVKQSFWWCSNPFVIYFSDLIISVSLIPTSCLFFQKEVVHWVWIITKFFTFFLILYNS